MTKKKVTKAFNYTLDFKQTDFREHPELYRVGVGEQGVLLVEPYKSELLPLWRFRTELMARESAEAIYEKFKAYLREKDFVGADMARKYLQMGFTRARRYANHASGKKYTEKEDDGKGEQKSYPYSQGSIHKGNEIRPQEEDALTSEKAKAAAIFKHYWDEARQNPDYLQQKKEFTEKYVS
ncbi:hypothetical protein BWI96_04440 [Siphonobacter sp. SORGH_AS_0500]|uniref:DUF4385 domain-containing protein n=1 Tax=Siphonobacter sp. SORGH_AS_0500 TaxID=1864824 RepID=UPI000CC470E0|nr:DUF4385 domain-containing protein [Siphonobacter sp. SORGH_AS_0500]PKK37722.1 hypothetical protein BWI96_04440 [Siphonobacter sp. SORGH_AS_0500]